MSGKRYKNNGKNTEMRIKFIRKLLPLLAVILVFAAAFYSDFQSYAADSEKDTLKLEQTIDQKDGKLTVTAEAEKDVLPEGTEMKVKAVGKTGDDYKAVEKRLKESADRQDRSLSGFLAYDISFWADGKEAEPDGKVDITMKWSDPVCPKGASKDDKVSVVHLEEKKDGGIKDSKVVDLTKSGKKDKEKNNKAKVDANRENEVRSAKITVDSFSVFAVQWTDSRSDEEKAAGNVKAPKIKVHYMDGYGKDIETAETVNFGTVTDREGNKILSKDIKGYDFKNARIGDVSTDSLKVDDGELFYKADGKWVRAQDSDLYLFYEKKSGDSKAGETEKDGKNSDQKKAQAEKPEYESGKLTAETEDYKATVSYGAGAKIPENAELRVYSLSKDEQAFKSAKAAVLETKGLGFDADSLGMKAVDISIMNNGEEYEPAEPVKVSIHMKNLPKDVDNVDVHHIPSSSMTAENALSNPIRKAPGLADKANAVMAAENIAVKKGDADTEFSVSGFSVFTITWSKTRQDQTYRFAQVKLHYVDENGNELADPTNQPASEMFSQSENGIVTLRNYAEDSINNNTSRMANYTYTEARLSNAKTGIVVTGFLGKETTFDSKTTYSLKYTTANPVPAADDSSWTDIPADAITGANNNSVDVYLIYSEEPKLTVHYVNEAGTDVATADVKYYSTITGNDGVAVSTLAKTEGVKSGYSFENDGGRLDSTLGQKIYSIKAVVGNKGSYTLQYKSSSDTDWTTADENVTDLYLLYSRSSGRKITIHYVDEAGVPIRGNGQEATKVVYPDEWTDSDSTASNNSAGHKYIDLSKYAESFAGYQDWNKDSVNAGNDGSRLMYSPATSLATSRGLVTGARNFRFIRYIASGTNANQFQIGRGNLKDNKTTVSEGEYVDSDINVYMFYPRLLRIHYVDSDGTELYDTFTTTQAINYSANNFEGTISLESDSYYNGHGTPEHIYAYDPSDSEYSTQTDITSIAWKWDDTGKKWQTQLSGSDSVDSLISDVYMVYPSRLNVTVHHVDSDGNKIAGDSTQTVSPSDTGLTIDTFKKTVANYDATNVYYGGSASTGTEFSTIKFTKNDRQWQYTINDGSATDIDGNAEVYVVYTKKTDGRAVTIHFVDEQGNEIADSYVFAGITVSSSGDTYKNKWNGGNMTGQSSITNSANYKAIPSGYSFVGEYLGPDFNMEKGKLVNSSFSDRNAVQWYYDPANQQWYTSHGEGAQTSHDVTATCVYKDYITDIYWVYKKNESATLIRHYGYMTDNTDQTTKFNAFTGLNSTTYPGTIGIDKSKTSVVPTRKTVTSGGKTYSYAATFVSNTDNRSAGDNNTQNGYNRLVTDGLKVTDARIRNGKVQYLVVSKIGNNDETEVEMTMLRRNRWGFTTDSGRSYTLRKEGNNLSIVYSLGGTSAFDLNLTSTKTDGGVTTNTYTATSDTEGRGVVYTVKEVVSEGSTNPTYKLSISEWVENKQTDLYHIYQETTADKVSVMIANEVVYTGNLIASAKGLPEGATITAYEWQKSDNTVDSGDYKNVTRKQNGNEWNINYLPQERSWLNLAADDGEMSTSKGRTSVKYKVRVKYKVGEGEEHTSGWSPEFTVPYYDQLENGGFEKPKKTATDNEALQYSNAAFKSEGIWQTTGLGNDTIKANTTGKDIEIVNTRNSKFRASYGWKKDLNNDGAKEGSQFAELNCEAAGALYQDVVTNPNEYLNYWLSHRARGNTGWTEAQRNNNTYYDTMYLVIMPTSLAMTSAPDGGELITQDDLTSYIDSHGGYDSSKTNNRTSEENTVIYKDMKSGVLIVRITSDNLDWHSISETNGYIATSNLTRFFFVAGPCASGNNTVGNFIDDVGLSQSLPTPTTPHYHMVVKKTFSGLTRSEIANLASNKAGSDKAFKFTIKEYKTADDTAQSDDYFESDKDTSATNRAKYTRLNNAELSFTTDASNNFTLTATTKDPDDSSKRVNLLTGSSTGVETEDPLTGDITMTWTLYNNYIESGNRYFKVTESGQDVSGYTLTENINGTVSHGETDADPASTNITGNIDTGVTNVITVKDKDTARVNYSNSYRDSRYDGNPMITVRKTFSGVTSHQVKQMLASGDNQYKVQLKKGETTLNLVGDATQPYSGALPTGVSSVRFSYEDGANGSAVLTWHILGKTTDDNWVTDGDYTVSESGFKSQGTDSTEINGNPSEIIVNGERITLSGDNWPSEQKNVTIGGTAESNKSNITVKTTGDGVTNSSGITSGTTYPVSSSTQIIAAKYTTGNGTETHFIVWTDDALGLNDRDKVISQLSQVTGFTDLKAANTTFQNGDQDEITVPSVGSVTTSYDGGGHLLLTFNSTAGSTNAWTNYFASTYTGEGEPEVSISNIYEPYVKLKKVNADNSTIVLSGAKFKIYKKDGSGNKTYLKKNGSTWSKTSDESDATPFTSDENGNIDIGRLVPGQSDATYYFEETDAPNGYNKLTKPIAFTVKPDGTVEASNADDSDNSVATLEWDSPYYTITVKNSAGIVLPETGGFGIWPFIIAGLVLALAAAYGLWKRKHRYVGRHEAN